MSNIYRHWDLKTLMLYILMGLIGAVCLYFVKKKEKKTGKKQKITSFPYLFWFFTWVIFAAYRYIDYNIGGTDAIVYVKYFSICLDSYIPSYYQHYDVLYRVLNILIRFISNDVHVYLIAFYSILVFSYILFLNDFSDKNVNIAPYILTFYLYLRGFNTFRSNLAISLILIGIVLLGRNKKKLSLVVMLSTFFIQKAAILYSLGVYIFVLLFKKGKIKIKHCIVLAFVGFFIGKYAQSFLINLDKSILNGAYSAYARKSLISSFFDNFWKICFEQLILLVFVVLYNTKIRENNDLCDEPAKSIKQLIYIICLFDFVTIPITYILSIWRGYEFLYLPRLVMWNEIINIIGCRFDKFSRKIVAMIFTVVFVAWMSFRIYNTWEASSLMPYIFEPFMWLK